MTKEYGHRTTITRSKEQKGKEIKENIKKIETKFIKTYMNLNPFSNLRHHFL